MEQDVRISAIRAIQRVYAFSPGLKEMIREAETKVEMRGHIRTIVEEMKLDYTPRGIVRAGKKLLEDKYLK